MPVGIYFQWALNVFFPDRIEGAIMIKTLDILPHDGFRICVNVEKIECIYENESSDKLANIKLVGTEKGFQTIEPYKELHARYQKAIDELNAMEFAAVAFSVSLGDTKANMAKWAFNSANAMIAESKKENK
jgi:hypothetical protein